VRLDYEVVSIAEAAMLMAVEAASPYSQNLRRYGAPHGASFFRYFNPVRSSRS
jgi:hypothetical protein